MMRSSYSTKLLESSKGILITVLHIVGIPDSIREQLYNWAVLRSVGEVLPANLTVDELESAELPFYDQALRSIIKQSLQTFAA